MDHEFQRPSAITPLVWWRGCLATPSALERIAELEEADRVALAARKLRVITIEDVRRPPG